MGKRESSPTGASDHWQHMREPKTLRDLYSCQLEVNNMDTGQGYASKVKRVNVVLWWLFCKQGLIDEDLKKIYGTLRIKTKDRNKV